LAIAAGTTAPASSAATLAQKRAQAARVAAQVNKLDVQYDQLQERYRGAQYRLGQLTSGVHDLNADLRQTQKQLDVAQARLVNRAVVVYQAGSSTTQVVSLAEAGSLDAFVDRMDTIRRVGDQDAHILSDIKQLRTRVATKQAQLKDARAEQVTVVAQASHDKKAMAKKLAARQAVLNSVNGEIRSMVEAQRKAQLERARARARAAARPADTAVTPTANDAGGAFSGGGAAPPASGKAAQAASYAVSQIGVPYVWGGASPSGFDCSGLVVWSFAQVGISLPHSSYALYNAGPHVSRSELQVGDLVFFSGLGHVGIYTGGGSFVHAPHTGTTVQYGSLNDSYGTSSYVGAVRITG
jgi:cell wall-associated NlpC family hydrolase